MPPGNEVDQPRARPVWGAVVWLSSVAVWLIAAAAAISTPNAAAASITRVFAGKTLSGNAVPCLTQTDGLRVCHGADGGGGAADLRLKSFDGQPLEVYAILP